MTSSSRPLLAAFPSRSTPTTPEPALLLTIRPSLSLPDIHLDVLFPSVTPVAKLKQQIRERLGPTYSKRRIRLIYQGRILADGAVLSSVVRAPPPPPRRNDVTDDDDRGNSGFSASGKGKGKGEEGYPLLPSAKAKGKKPLPAPIRVYINASIGDVLTPLELEAEKLAAAKVPTPSSSSAGGGGTGMGRNSSRQHPGGGIGPAGEGPSTATNPSSSSTHPAPRGFDRLLTTGFTRPEVSALRLQFRSIQASRHTADTMPSPDTLRDMEDAWIDSNAFAPSSSPYPSGGDVETGAGGGGAGGGGADEGDEPHRWLDIVIPAMAIGFFFPLGTFGWLARQDGLWSTKWQFLALLGFFSSLLIGIVRTIAGDG